MKQKVSYQLKRLFVAIGFPVVAILILIDSLNQWGAKENLQILVAYTILAVVCSFAPIRTYNAALTLNGAVIFSAILLKGPWLAIWAVVIEVIVLGFLFRAPKKVLPNIGQWLATIWIVGLLQEWLVSLNVHWAIADLLLLVVCYAANTGLCAILISYYVNVTWWTKVKEMIKAGTAVYFMLMVLGGIGARLVAYYGSMAMIPVLVAFVTISFVFRQYFDGLVKLEEKVAEVKSLNHSFLTAMAHSVDARDPYTHGHSQRVATLGREIARKMEMPESFADEVYFGGILHDIGKIGIEDYILKKEGKLTAEEFERIKEHTVIGYQIIKQSGVFEELLPAIRSHHERIDGKGYPDGLKGNDIPLIARILAVADSFDAMVSDRPYRKGMDVKEALRRIEEGAGSQFDPNLARVFIDFIQKLPPEQLETFIRTERRTDIHMGKKEEVLI